MNKVVPFERGSEYLRRRAQINLRAGRLLDALDLQRRASEKGGGLSCRMDMAQILCRMGCFEESNRVLAGMIREPGAPEDCYMGLCCNYVGMGEQEMAYRTLIQFLSLSPQAAGRDEVSQMFHNLMQMRAECDFLQGGRRAARSVRLRQAARRQKAQGNLSVCVDLLRRAVSIVEGFKDQEARAALAAALSKAGEHEQAVRHMDLALSGGEAGNRVLGAAASVYAAAGKMDKARLMVKRLSSRQIKGADIRVLLDACCAVGDDERVRQLAPRALAQTPYDRRLLHQLAVNRVREGRPASQAVSYWARALRVDPGDMVARHGLRQAAAGRLDRNMSYEYALPESERAKWRRQLAQSLLYLDDAALKERYLKSHALEEKCRWALYSGDRSALLLARALLKRLDDPMAARLLGESMAFSAAGDVSAQDAIHPDITMMRVPPRMRRAMKAAIGAAALYCEGLSPYIVRVVLIALNEGVRRLPAGPLPIAAALFYLAARGREDAPTLEQAAQILPCSVRRAARCARLLDFEEDEHEAD